MFIADRSAIAVTMPGSAIGRTSTNDTVSRPKNRNRCTANAASVPSRQRERGQQPTPTFTEVPSAMRMFGSSHASPNQRVVNPVGGQFCATLLLNA